jgi:hypothetical protein
LKSRTRPRCRGRGPWPGTAVGSGSEGGQGAGVTPGLPNCAGLLPLPTWTFCQSRGCPGPTLPRDTTLPPPELLLPQLARLRKQREGSNLCPEAQAVSDVDSRAAFGPGALAPPEHRPCWPAVSPRPRPRPRPDTQPSTQRHDFSEALFSCASPLCGP